ncbi:MAG: efflux RND transporter periplasmic adaptor subunit [Steroidobacteraceae bacterium]|jgi:membrane fusion protein (multidrug efflux system)|nr:efflux RND transporter periplasmic adaptor subunit [Steroidobacteraceae bacterium]
MPRARSRPRRARFPALLLLAGAVAGLAACSESPEQLVGNGGPGDRPMSRNPPPVPVVTTVPERRAFGVEIEAVGTALANESVEITSKTSNTVTAIRFREGQVVRRGAVLVELDRSTVAAELAEAEATLADARNQFNRGRDLSVTQALSKAQLEQLETAVKTAEARVAAARARFNDTVIRAPFDGRTGFRRVSLGGLVNAGAVITTLDDTSVIKLEFTMPQSFLNELVPGLPIEATTEGLPTRVFEGKVTTIGSRVDANTRSIPVRAELPNRDGVLRPGMFMSVRVKGREAPTLMLPEEALVPEQGKTYVYVVAEGRAARRAVQTGGRVPGSVAVLAGLEPGERVIVEGTQRVRDGALVAEAARTAGGGDATATADSGAGAGAARGEGARRTAP